MPRKVRIGWGGGASVTGRLAMPRSGARLGMLLAHGAGAGQDHPFMTTLRDGIARHGVAVLTFDYPYVEAGRGRPDAPAKLLACHHAAAQHLARNVDTVVLAGKSMGGRMASHLAAGVDQNGKPVERFEAAGLVYYGYPLVAIGKTEPRDTTHLRATGAPSLFFAGTRDAMGPIDLVRALVDALPAAELHVIAEGNHSFKVPKRAGKSESEVMEELTEASVAWMGRL